MFSEVSWGVGSSTEFLQAQLLPLACFPKNPGLSFKYSSNVKLVSRIPCINDIVCKHHGKANNIRADKHTLVNVFIK